MTQFVHLLIAALYAMLFQNLVLTAVFGISESVKIAKRPKHFIMYAASIAFFSITVSVCCAALEKVKFISSLHTAFHYLIYVAVLSVIYLICGFVSVKILKANKKFMNSLGMCAFNTLVICVPILDFKANYSFAQSLGTGIGAAFAFVIAVLLINAGMRFIYANKYMPTVFRGTPALLIYIAILSMALSCFSGEPLFI